MDEDVAESSHTMTKESSQKDKGWAWVITAGATLHLFLHNGMGKSFGLFFVEFLSFYDTNSSVLSGMIAAQNIVYTLSSLVVLNVGNRLLSNRTIIIAGGIMLSAGYLCTAFSPNVLCLVLSQSLLIGFGISCTTGPVFVVLNSYFEKRLGFSNSLVNVGGSIGSLVMPIIIERLLDYYGFRGALLIISGLVLHNVVAGFLMRPFPSTQKSETSERNQEISSGPASKEEKESLYNEISIFNHQTCNTYDNGQLVRWTEKFDRTQETSLDAAVKEEKEPLHTEVHKTEIRTNNIIGNQVTTNNRLVLFSMLKNYRLQLNLFVAFVSCYGSIMIGTYIPPFARDRNITTKETAILVMIVGGFGVLSRLILAFITDSKCIHRYQIMGVSIGVTGIATMFNPIFQSYEAFIAYSVIFGLFGSGVYFALIALLLRESVGPEKISPVFSLMIVIHGLSTSTTAPLLGYLRDTTGSYIASFYVMGFGLIIGSIATFCVPLVKRLEEARLERTARSHR